MASPPGVHSKEKGRDMRDPGKIWFCFSLSTPHELSEAGLQSSIYHHLLPPLLQQVCSPGGLAVSSTCLNVTAFLPSCLEQAPHILYFGTGQDRSEELQTLCRSLLSLKGSIWNRMFGVFFNVYWSNYSLGYSSLLGSSLVPFLRKKGSKISTTSPVFLTKAPEISAAKKAESLEIILFKGRKFCCCLQDLLSFRCFYFSYHLASVNPALELSISYLHSPVESGMWKLQK